MSNQPRLFLTAAAAVLCGATALVAAAEPEGHRFGEWPAINAMIHGCRQKNLDLDGKDFLIEVWFKPLPTLKAKPPEMRNCLVCKKACEAVAGYELSYTNDGWIGLALCDKSMEMDADLGLSVPNAVNMESWNYFAVACSHKDRKVVFYRDGKVLKEFGGVKVGDMSNHDMFSVGYCEYAYNSQAHCRISQVRVWRFPRNLPADLDKALAAHNDSPDKPSESLTASTSIPPGRLPPPTTTSRTTATTATSCATCPGATNPARRSRIFRRKYRASRTGSIRPAPPPATPTPAARTSPSRPSTPPPRPPCRATWCTWRRESIARRSSSAAARTASPLLLRARRARLSAATSPSPAGTKPTAGCGSSSGAGIMPAPSTTRPPTPAPSRETDSSWTDGSWTSSSARPNWFRVPGRSSLSRASAPRRLTLCPIPGVDPTKVPTEISEVVSAPLLTTAKFNHVRNIHFTRGGVLLRGMCNRFENNVIDWCCWNGLAYGTSDNVIRGNKILWCGLTGFGSSGGARITFEKNLVSYCSWRPFAMGWHGGAIKIIPACIDFAMRDNEICYNDVAGLWYDTNNQGNLNEGNLLHDNFGPGGFDEYSFHNTWRYNLAYNNIGCGLGVCNSSGDTVYRNICFDNGYCGIQFRVNSLGTHNPPELRKSMTAEFMAKFDVRRYEGMLTYEREKKIRNIVEKFTCDFDGDQNVQNTVRENVLISAGGCSARPCLTTASGSSPRRPRTRWTTTITGPTRPRT